MINNRHYHRKRTLHKTRTLTYILWADVMTAKREAKR